MCGWLRGLARLAVALLGSAAALASASVLHVCDDRDKANAAQQDRQLRFAAVVRERLQASQADIAIVSRAGLALGRFGMRYSHAGFSVRRPADPATPAWAVRQLYFDCTEARPRLFDQGLSAFVLGAEQPDAGWLSVLLLPQREAAALARAVMDDALASGLLHPRYSANAYAWALDFQNCNQWVAEMLAAAWAVPGSSISEASGPAGERARAQAWLRDAGYEPAVFELRSPAVLLAGMFVPWIHSRDHPSADVDALRYRVSMPAAIEAFVQRQHPATRRIEFCYTPERIVTRENGPPLGETCAAGPQDREILFQPPNTAAR